MMLVSKSVNRFHLNLVKIIGWETGKNRLDCPPTPFRIAPCVPRYHKWEMDRNAQPSMEDKRLYTMWEIQMAIHILSSNAKMKLILVQGVQIGRSRTRKVILSKTICMYTHL